MRYAISILIILTIFGCQTSSTQPEGQRSESSESGNLNGKDSAAIRVYITDPAYLNYDYHTELKHGYRLEYRVYTEPEVHDTLQTIFLMKGAVEIKDLNGGSYGLPHKNIGYIGADFDSSFVFVQSFGSGNPHYIQLIDKKSGRELRTGTWVDADESEQILLYIENEKLKIYDIKNGNEIIVTDFKDSKCVERASGGLRNCVEIDTVSIDNIVLKIDTDEERIIKKYDR